MNTQALLISVCFPDLTYILSTNPIQYPKAIKIEKSSQEEMMQRIMREAREKKKDEEEKVDDIDDSDENIEL